MTNHEDCLVLNADYSPIGIIGWRKAMVWSFRYSHSQYSGIEIIDHYKDDIVLGANGQCRIPAVVRTTKYFKLIGQPVVFSRKNLFIRDDYMCQYCGAKPPISQLTYDHIIPKSKGGKHEWQNVVACCKRCNLIKADKDLNQTILKLIQSPLAPEGNFWIKTIIGSNPDPEWEEYLISA